MFFTGPNESPFISKRFKNWNTEGQCPDAYAHSEEHQLSEEKMTNFLKTRLPGNDISARLQRQAAKQPHHTMKGALPVIDVVIELGQTGSPLGENKDPLKEMRMEISPSLLTGNRYMIQNSKTI